MTQNTLAIIKPDYMQAKTTIMQLLRHNGFRMTHRKIVFFTPEQAAEFYKELENQDPCFAIKVMCLSKGPAEAIILNKVQAVNDLLTLMASPGCCHLMNSGLEYKIHASASESKAETEIRFIFPNVILQPNRKVRFGSICGREKMTGLFADATFDACESKADDVRNFLSKWLFDHSYEFESQSWCDQ